MKKRYLLLAGGVDRKGIVYSLTNILKDHKFNIEDSSMMMLRKTFSVIMLLSNNKKFSENKFQGDVMSFMKKNRMTVDIRRLSEKEMAEYKEKGCVYMVSISGADKPGIVNTMTEAIYKKGGNIIGLETKSSEKVRPHAYYMFLEVEVPKKVTRNELINALEKQGKKLKVHISVNRVDKSIL